MPTTLWGYEWVPGTNWDRLETLGATWPPEERGTLRNRLVWFRDSSRATIVAVPLAMAEYDGWITVAKEESEEPKPMFQAKYLFSKLLLGQKDERPKITLMAMTEGFPNIEVVLGETFSLNFNLEWTVGA